MERLVQKPIGLHKAPPHQPPDFAYESQSAMVETPMEGGQRKTPERIGGALQALLAKIDSEGHFEIFRLMRVWPAVVGETIARRTEVTALKFHTAVVKVSGAMWIQELNLMKPQILAGLREAMRNDAVRDVRFVQGRLSRREKPRLRAVTRGTRRTVELPEIKDAKLRAAFQSLIEAWGRSPR